MKKKIEQKWMKDQKSKYTFRRRSGVSGRGAMD
jgi:hypothetical protein